MIAEEGDAGSTAVGADSKAAGDRRRREEEGESAGSCCGLFFEVLLIENQKSLHIHHAAPAHVEMALTTHAARL
jgi:hypothetical protein